MTHETSLGNLRFIVRSILDNGVERHVLSQWLTTLSKDIEQGISSDDYLAIREDGAMAIVSERERTLRRTPDLDEIDDEREEDFLTEKAIQKLRRSGASSLYNKTNDTERRQRLIEAGALIAAQIDKLARKPE